MGRLFSGLSEEGAGVGIPLSKPTVGVRLALKQLFQGSRTVQGLLNGLDLFWGLYQPWRLPVLTGEMPSCARASETIGVSGMDPSRRA